MYVIVAGCGRVGSHIADTLSQEGHDVVVIDKDSKSFDRLGPTFNGVTFQGVVSDEDVLIEAGVQEADAFLAMTSYDSTNLMASEIATSIFEVPTVLSRLYSVDKEMTLFQLGIDYVCSTTLTSEHFMDKLFQGTDAISLMDRPELGVKLLEFNVRPEAQGRSALELDSDVNSRLIAVLRMGRLLNTLEGVTLEAGDRLIVALRKEGRKAVIDCLGDDYANETACRFTAAFPDGTSEILQEAPAHSRIIIGGCSAVGSHLAFMLSMEGHDVTVIDQDPSRFDRMPESFNGTFLQGTVFEEETLLAAGIEDASKFAVLTKFDNKNMMAAEVARQVFNVPKVVARLFNMDKESTYQSLGIDFVCGTRLLSGALLDRLLDPLVESRGSCFNNLFDVVDFKCPSWWVNKDVEHFERKMGFRLAYIGRGSSGILPGRQFVLREDDVLTAIMPPGEVRELDRHLKKK